MNIFNIDKILPNFDQIIGNLTTTPLDDGAVRKQIQSTIGQSNLLGYVNNKKGSAITYDSTFGTAVYILSINKNATGNQLFIETYHGTTGYLTEGHLLSLELPYRIVINDKAFFDNVLTPLIVANPTLKSAFEIFNPGVAATYANGKYSIDASFSGTTKMIQLNLPRSVITKITENKTYCTYKNLLYRGSSSSDIQYRRSTFTVDDLQASIIVKKDVSEPDKYDWIYLTVCSRVNHTDYNTGKSQSWTLPITLCYKFEKSNIKASYLQYNTSMLPYSWTYPINSDWYGSPPSTTYIGKINNISSTPQTKLWNYSIIPHRLKADNTYTPLVLGCLADMTYKDSTNLYIYSVIGNDCRANEGRGMPQKQYHTLCNIDMTTTQGFLLPTSKDVTFLSDSKELCGSVTIQYTPEDYIAIAVDSYLSNGINSSTFRFYNSSLNIKSSLRITMALHSDLTLQNNKLYIKYSVDNGNTITYEFPTINDSMLSSLNVSLATVPNPFITAGCTLKLNWTLYKFTRSLTRYIVPDEYETILYVDSLAQDKSYSKSYTNYSNIFLQFTSNYNMVYHFIIFDGKQNFKYVNKSIADTGTTITIPWIGLGNIFVTSEDGMSPDDYCILQTRLNNNIVEVDSVQVFKPIRLNISSYSTATPYYWADTTLGYSYSDSQNTNINDNQINSTSLAIDIHNCSGIFSKLPIGLTAYNKSLTPWLDPNNKMGGVEINTDLIADTTFKYGGDYNVFLSALNSWSGGYWALSNGFIDITFKDSDGNNLLYNNIEKQTDNITFWAYGDTGLCNIQTVLKLDLRNGNSVLPYTHPDYTLPGCVFGVTLKDCYGKVLDQKSYIINIDPPDGSGEIHSDDRITKTIEDFNFNLSREWRKGYQSYTEILNVIKNYKTVNGNIQQSSNPQNFNTDPPLIYQVSTPLNIKVKDMERGSYVFYQYEPKLNGTKPIINDIVGYSEYVTNCSGHKYSISDVSVQFGFADVYQANVIDTITQIEYIYIDTVNDSCQVKVTLDIDHENWNESFRDNLDGTGNSIYPLISGIYLLAVNEYADNYSHINVKEMTEYSFPKLTIDSTKTYPNINPNNGFSSTIKQLINTETDNVYATGLFFTPTECKLSNQEIVVEIKKSGKYRLYLEVEDEFQQFSTWCITNKKNNFNYPIREV